MLWPLKEVIAIDSSLETVTCLPQILAPGNDIRQWIHLVE